MYFRAALLASAALRAAVLIIDEAHNLVDRSREYYSPAITSADLDRARSFLERQSNEVFDQLAELVELLADEVHRTVAESLGDERHDEGPAKLDHDSCVVRKG